jgi:hypothetical protein
VRRLASSLVPLAVVVATLLPASVASALSYPVTSTADTGADGTLRWAIEEANDQGGADSIPIEVSGAILLGSALPTLEGDLAIVGRGPEVTTIGREALAGSFGILDLSGGDVSLEGMKIANGDSTLGGGIQNGTGGLTLTKVAVVGNEATTASILDPPARGGGIYSVGPLTLRESTVSGNRAVAEGSAEAGAEGGGIFAGGELTIDRSTVSGNLARDLSGGSELLSALGGGIYAGGEVTIDRSTISGNSVFAEEGTGAIAAGGGLFATGAGELTGVTLTANSALGAGTSGSNLRAPGDWVLRNTIVADPKGDAESCLDNFDSGGYNLDEDDSCGLEEGSDLVGIPAGLDPELKDNGGPTATHALLAGSLAIDRGNSFGDTTDQRGLPRPSNFPTIGDKEGGDGSDIGAFELQAPAPPATPSGTSGGGSPVLVFETPTDRSPPNTRIASAPPRNTYKRPAKFRFASSEPQSRFECKLDQKGWIACANPFKRSVKPGRHFFQVRAIDRFGNVDPTPARFGWRLKPIVG